MKINPFGRRRVDGPPFEALLENYVARAQAIADAGGGYLWVVEPSLSPDVLPDFTEAVARHLADNAVSTGGISFLDGTASARIAVLTPTSSGADDTPIEVVLGDDELALPSEPVSSDIGLSAQ